MMICFIHIRLVNLGLTKYTCAKKLYFEILAASEYGGALPLFTQVATGYRVQLRNIEYRKGKILDQ